jgi:PAS domain S-box-containing protein
MATILVVDDLPANREFLVTLLGYQGHRLLEAADGRGALAIVREARPDLVITDILMPVMDGYEFLKELRLDPEHAATPVIFFTSYYGEREAVALRLSNNVSWVLTKPVEPGEVLRVVDRVLAGESATGTPPAGTPLTPAFDQQHLHLLTDQLSEHAADLRAANDRLKALIDIGLELASERDATRLLERVCIAAREMFKATYVTLGILDPDDHTVRLVLACGPHFVGEAAESDWVKTGDAAPGILGAVVLERRAIRGENPGGNPAGLQLPVPHPKVERIAVAPIASPSHVYGWLCLVRNEEPGFTEESEQLLVSLSGQIGRIYESCLLAAVAQKRAQEFERERDRAQRYLDIAEVILLALDTHGRITLVNRYACDLLGWTASELIGRDWLQTCIPANQRDRTTKRFRGVLRGDMSAREALVLTKWGDERLIEWHNTVLRDDAGNVNGTFSSGTDITARKKAVEELRTAEERMRFALESADVGIWDLDYTTGTLDWSKIIESQHGCQPGTFAGTFEAFLACIHPDDRAAVMERMEQGKRDGKDFTVQYRSMGADGKVRWLLGAGRVLLGEKGEPLRAVGITQDITKRLSLEAQYQQAQKMEAVGRLAGGVAHDFNNLLTAILGYCELLLAETEAKDPRRADISEILKAGQKAAALTRQLLAFSRKQIVEPTMLDLSAVAAEMKEMIGRLIGEDVKLVVRRAKELARVKADRGQIEQVIMNLAVNARDAMPKGGTLTIETANIQLDEHYAKTHRGVKPGPYVGLTVSDTGTGMSAQVQERIFEPFFTTKETGKGTGLGLATAYGIVTGAGGSIGVYSELGKGSAFKVYLPAAEAGAEPIAVAAPKTRAKKGTQTVLVVEDAEMLRRLTKRLLEGQGYTVLVAADAEEAMRLVEANPSIEVLLTDVVMPGASGPELSARLAKDRPAIKVIFMSGYTEEAIVQHGILNPGITFLHKPFSAETLGEKIRQVLGR